MKSTDIKQKYTIDNIPDTEVKPFWKPYGEMKYCCQWYKSNFSSPKTGRTFICMEQYMMYQKAILFGDKESADKIMKETDPAKIQKLGRGVKNFDTEMWDEFKYGIVCYGNYLKFSQNETLKKWLKSTGDSILVEASPYDGVWGVKMNEADPNIDNPDMWRGQNLLGFALMQVRDEL